MFAVTGDKIKRQPTLLQGAFVLPVSGIVKPVQSIEVHPTFAMLVFADEECLRVSLTGDAADGALAVDVVSL